MTSTRVQLRRDTAANFAAAVLADGEAGWDQDNKRLAVGDGASLGGIPLATYKDAQNCIFTAAVAGGTANALTISTFKNPSSLANLQGVKVKIATTNTGAVTLQWGSLPATAIKKYSGTAKIDLAAGNLIAGKIYHFDFDGVDFVLFAEGGSSMPAGAMVGFAGVAAPTGWLMCAGQAVSRTTYAELFAAIGVTYGAGDGSTTFNLPDARGRVIAGKDDMGGTAANRLTGASGGVDGAVLGDAGGAETHTLTTSQMPSHAHSAAVVLSDAAGGVVGFNYDTSGSSASTKNTNNQGGGGAHNNVQPTLVQNIIIKT